MEFDVKEIWSLRLKNPWNLSLKNWNLGLKKELEFVDKNGIWGLKMKFKV